MLHKHLQMILLHIIDEFDVVMLLLYVNMMPSRGHMSSEKGLYLSLDENLMNILAADHGQLKHTPWHCWLLQCRRDNDDHHHHLHQVYSFSKCTKTEQWYWYR